MQVVQDGIELCEDCTIAAVNGDFTGLDNHPETSDRRMAEIVSGLERLGADLVPDFDSESGRGMEEFSSRPCQCCGSRLAGSRHSFAVLGRDT